MGIEYATYRGTYRAGVIGHTGRGNYGHGLDAAFVGLPDVQLVAVADPDDEGREEAVGRTGAERSYADYREMLAQENLDLVAIGPRWLDQHEAITIATAEAGVKAIYAEKPIAPSLEAADRMLAACDKNGVKISYAHQNRAYPAQALVREHLASGKLGRLRVIRAFGKQDRRGGGMDLLVLGTHMLDLMRHFAGDAHWCHAHVTRNGRDATAEDVETAAEEGGLIAGDDVIAQYGFDSGVLGSYECGRAGDGGGSPYFRMEVCGTDGVLAFWSSPDSPIYAFP
ncbi:MAG: 3-chlorobenzoate-3,4-dioxygenase, partial [Dehalococcoidia bacterium]|nr:3-chlorobenzoate-3,4-dioxygenase [Dehalococcoidia bacterium]